MTISKTVFISVFLILGYTESRSQEAAAIDSIKRVLSGSKTDAKKVFWMDNLSRTLMNVNPAQADSSLDRKESAALSHIP